MSSDNLPAVRKSQPIVQKKETDREIVDSRNTKLSQSSLSSLAGQVVKTAVYAALEWLSERRASERSLIDRRNEVLPAVQNNTRQSLVGSSGEIRNRHSVMKDASRFNPGGKFKPQRSRPDGRRIRQRKRRWR